MLAQRARETGSVIVYVNQVGGQDELVFEGSSVVMAPTGSVASRLKSFDSDFTVIDIAADGTVAVGDVIPFETDLDRVYAALVVGTRDYVRKNGFSSVVIGLSGGIDSSIVAAVAVEALGADNVHGIAMPSRYSSQGSLDDADRLAQALGIDHRVISIEPAFTAYLEMLAPSFEGRDPDLTEENLQSRCRGMTLMAMSNKFGWMVLTTGNKSEMAVGYFTIYGDSAGGYAVIKDVFKTQVFDLCRRINERAGREIIPETVIIKPPSAELRPDQRDDQSLPPYEELDPILRHYVDNDLSVSEIVKLGFDQAVVARIARLVDVNEYKRRQCAPGVRVSTKAFGKDRRVPITNGYRADRA
jgi:NAD+ synthase (glutamine-hydrolysing)